MDRFIGMDVHASSSTLAIVGPTGKRIRDFVLETNGKALVEAVTLVPGCRHLCLEEGTHSDWLYEILSPHVRRVVVLGQNQKRRGPKSDKLDAYDLAERLRVGNIDKSVFKPAGQFAELRALVRTYDKVVQDHTRAQNRLKALFRSRGIATPGRAVYRPEQRADWLAQLPGAMRTSARWLLTESMRSGRCMCRPAGSCRSTPVSTRRSSWFRRCLAWASCARPRWWPWWSARGASAPSDSSGRIVALAL